MSKDIFCIIITFLLFFNTVNSDYSRYSPYTHRHRRFRRHGVGLRAVLNENDEYSATSQPQLGLSTDVFDQLPPCNEDELVTYLAQLQIINPESIVLSSSVDDVEDLCLKVNTKLENIDEYLQNCQPPQQKDLYIQLIKGIDALQKKLCSKGKFKDEFLKSWPCYHDLQEEFQSCNGPEDWSENLDDRQVCKAYEDIETCYYVKTAKVCGEHSAHLMKELTEAVLDSVLTVDCGVLPDPEVPDANPNEAGTIGYEGGQESIQINFGLILLLFSMCWLF